MRQFLPLIVLLGVSACTPQTNDSAEAPSSIESYQAQGWTAKTLPELSAALNAGEVTSETLVTDYLARIALIDQSGPDLQAILALNPNALADARAIDGRRAAGENLGALAGLPIVLKDNIETLDPMATTAGALALAANVTGRDAPLAAGLRARGAIILGKSNLSQWANFRSNESVSGWSALGGQVRNPHMLDRSPCGSSAGSGVAVAASLAAGAVGTETNGSIICPSHVNGIVGFKPSVGLVSQQYIVPISASQDTAGPMAKTVTGAAMLLGAMATDGKNTDYAAGLNEMSLSGKRIGVLRFSQGSNDDIISRFNAAIEVMENAGAELVMIEEFNPAGENFWGKSLDVLKYEFKAGLDEYLAEVAPAVNARSLTQIIDFNTKHADVEMALFDQDLLEQSDAMGALTDAAYLTARADVQSAARENGIDMMLLKYKVDMLVAPSGPISPRIDPINGDVWPQWAGAGYLAAIAGYPHITVPMGNVHGVPIGVSIMGAKDADAQILSYGYAYEQASLMRAAPQYHKDAEGHTEIGKAMQAYKR